MTTIEVRCTRCRRFLAEGRPPIRAYCRDCKLITAVDKAVRVPA